MPDHKRLANLLLPAVYSACSITTVCGPPHGVELTTVDTRRAEIGHLAFQAMIGPRRSKVAAGREIVVDPALVVRESTGPRKDA
jgi:hypothetical protein